jgi:Universal stress protein family
MSANEFTNVLVTVHGSDGSAKALGWALSLCSVSNAKLTVVAITEQPTACTASLTRVKRGTDGFLARALLDAKRAAKDRGVNARIELLPGESARALAPADYSAGLSAKSRPAHDTLAGPHNLVCGDPRTPHDRSSRALGAVRRALAGGRARARSRCRRHVRVYRGARGTH